jgi:hypothetical protein
VHDNKADGRGQADGFFQPCIGRAHRFSAVQPPVTVLPFPGPFPGQDDGGAGRSATVRRSGLGRLGLRRLGLSRGRWSVDLQVVNPRR